MPWTNETKRLWYGMIQRCTHRRHKSWPRYGGRGIAVCSRWMSFENFRADMGERPNGKSIERINNDRDYEPGNCRWATPKEQANNRSNNTHVEFRGERLTIAQWSERVGIAQDTLVNRLVRKQWPIESALTTPARRRKNNASTFVGAPGFGYPT